MAIKEQSTVQGADGVITFQGVQVRRDPESGELVDRPLRIELPGEEWLTVAAAVLSMMAVPKPGE